MKTSRRRLRARSLNEAEVSPTRDAAARAKTPERAKNQLNNRRFTVSATQRAGAAAFYIFLQSGFVVTILNSNEDSGCNARFTRARATTKSAGASGVELGLKQF